jgi:hypothetical protein
MIFLLLVFLSLFLTFKAWVAVVRWNARMEIYRTCPIHGIALHKCCAR